MHIVCGCSAIILAGLLVGVMRKVSNALGVKHVQHKPQP